MKYLCTTMLFISMFVSAQPNVKISYEKSEEGYRVYAQNNEYCPVMVKVNFSLNNLTASRGNNRMYTIRGQKTNLLTELKVTSKGFPYSFSYKYTSNFGKHNQKKYDADYEYHLPFVTSAGFSVMQGYEGTFSHQNENALDFDMPIGTEITAIREGVVVKVVQNNTTNCAQKICAKFNNYITIYQPDGTFAEYTHIQAQGSKVSVGDTVEQGQPIGLSGNVGWSSGPHLHLVVYIQHMEDRETLKTKFLSDKGDKFDFLMEDITYYKLY